METITVNPSNEPYYSEDFIKGFKCGAQRQLEADKADIPRWTSCSERLPNKGEVVLITNGKGHVRCGQFRSVDYVKDGITHWQWKGNTSETVLAWLPLPEPYKGEGDE